MLKRYKHSYQVLETVKSVKVWMKRVGLDLQQSTQMQTSQGLVLELFFAIQSPKGQPPCKQFEVTVFLRSKDCKVVMEASEKFCKPCSKANEQLRKASEKRGKASPAKAKASLAACGPEKLRATVQAACVECKELKDRLKDM